MPEYMSMWLNFANFSDRTTIRGYWVVFLANIIVGVALAIIIAIIPFFSFLSWLYFVAAIVPGIAITVRRLNDAGKEWFNIFWVFLPLVGTIILIIYLCQPSVAGGRGRTV